MQFFATNKKAHEIKWNTQKNAQRMNYTQKIAALITAKKMKWSDIPIARTTLDGLKIKDVYSTTQLETIANALGVPVAALVGDVRPFILIEELRSHIAEMQRHIDAINAAIESWQA